MKKLIVMLTAAFCGSVFAGTCTYSFSWLKNNPVSDIQVPITLVEGEGGFSHAGFADRTAGTDLRIFITGDDTPLPCEIEDWNRDGKTLAWVRVPNLSSETTLTVSWGDPDAPSAQGAVWANTTEFLLHFAADDIRKDSSANPADFTAASDSGTPIGAVAPVGSGATFGTLAERMRCTSSPKNKLGGLAADFTCSYWYRHPEASTSGTGYLFVFMPGNAQFAFLCGNDKGNMTIYNANGRTFADASFGQVKIPMGNDKRWHQYVFAYDSANRTMHGYVDGFEKLTLTNFDLSFHSEKTANAFDIKVGGATGGSWVSGSLDEVRLDSVYHDADWVRAQCETQAQALPDRNRLSYAFPDVGDVGTLADFPAYVRLDGSETGCTPSAFEGLRDRTLRVTDENGDEVDYAIETLNAGDVTSAGLWVRMPNFRNGSRVTVADTDVPYYVPSQQGAGADAPSAFDGSTVFADAAYYHVWHLDWNDGCVRKDSGRMGVDLRAMDKSPAVNSTFLCPPCDSPRGTWSGIRCGDSVACKEPTAFALAEPLTNVYTVSWWMRKDDVANPAGTTYLFCYTGTKSASSGNQSAIIMSGNDLKLFGGQNTPSTLFTLRDGAWHHYAIVNNGGTLKLYVDGICVKTLTNNYDFMCTYASDAKKYKLAVGCAVSGNNPLYGALSEFRIETVARSESWIRACVRTQSVFADGVSHAMTPAFAPGVRVSSTESSISCTARLSCLRDAHVTLCYGSVDRGHEAANWENSIDLGTVSEGEVTALVEALAADTFRFARFRAVNVNGEAWSELVSARTRPASSAGRGKYIPVEVTYDGAETLKDFPLAVQIPAGRRLPLSPNAIRVEAEDGAIRPFEVEAWDPSGTSVIWVRMPTVAGGEKLRIRWGGFAETSAAWSDTSAVWGDEFLRVYHFAPNDIDSSRFGADITSNDMAADGEGRIGGGYHYDGTATAGQEVQTGSSTVPGYCDFRNGFTISFWAKVDDSLDGKQCYVFANQFDVNSTDRLLEIFYNYYGTDTIALRVLSNTPNASFAQYQRDNYLRVNITRGDDGWHQYVWTHDGFALTAYRDGEKLENALHVPGVLGGKFPERTAVWTRFACTQSNDPAFKGALDEYRVEKAVRSEAWIKACYDNQTGGLVSVGDTVAPGMALTIR